LDEDIEADLVSVFPKKTQNYTVSGLGMSGSPDDLVIERAIALKALIVTADKKFVTEYENHDWRKGKDGRYFWGLIFLSPSSHITRSEQLKMAIKGIEARFDDILTVSATGRVTRKRLDGPRPKQFQRKK
jgi:hypothetical protein